jgi:integrase
MGHLYKPKKSRFYWMKYYVNGAARYESTRTESHTQASRLLKDREGRVATGQPVLPRADRIRFEEVADDLRRHYRTTGCRDLTEAEPRLAHLTRFFSGQRIASLGPADMTTYTEKRQTSGAANGTINRELAILGRMLRLAHENGKLVHVPTIRKLKESPPRQGFFEREQYEAVRQHLRPDLQVAVAIEYEYGWRCQSEVLILQRRQIDLDAGTIRLDPGQAKNEDGRVVYLPGYLKPQLAEQIERIKGLERETGRIIPSLFAHPTNGRRHKKGDPIRDFKKTWASACRKAGCPGMLRHDFRRTAVRDMVNDGVSERVAMTITGHKTRSVFDRYHIVSPADLQEAARKRETAAARPATVIPTVIPLAIAGTKRR